MKKNKLGRFLRKVKWFFTVYIWPNHESTIDTWNGLLSFYSKDRTLGRSLYVERGFEQDLMLKSIRILKDKKYIHDSEKGMLLDVGGYVGMISIGFVKNGFFNKAIAFEPNPDSFHLLEKNIKNNSMVDRVVAFNVALSDADDVLDMELSNKNYGDHRIRKKGDVEEGYFGEHKREIINVRTVKFDDFLSDNKNINEDEIKLVWMDIQGHEGKFFIGAKNFFKIKPNVPVIMEFGPYTIERSGLDKMNFCKTIQELFKYFYILDEDCVNRYSSDDIGDIYDKYNSPTNGAHLMLVNQTVV